MADIWEVFTIVDLQESKVKWVNIGVGFENKDGSFNLYLHALPLNGKIHIRQKREPVVEPKPTE